MQTIVIVPVITFLGDHILNARPDLTDGFVVLTGDPQVDGPYMPVARLYGDLEYRGRFNLYADALLFARTLSTLNNLPVDDRCAGHEGANL